MVHLRGMVQGGWYMVQVKIMVRLHNYDMDWQRWSL